MFPSVGKTMTITITFSIWHGTGGHHPNIKPRKRNLKRIQFELADIIEYFTEIRNKVLKYTWINLANIILSSRSQVQNRRFTVGCSVTGDSAIYEQIEYCLPFKGGKLTGKAQKLAFCGGANVLYIYLLVGHTAEIKCKISLY